MGTVAFEAYMSLLRWFRAWIMLFFSRGRHVSCSFRVRRWAVWHAMDSVSSDSVPSSVPASRRA